MLGPPGAGKGTQAKMLAEQLNIPHISTGYIFRTAIKNQTEMGKKAQEFIDDGNLVPDEITDAIVKERLLQPDCSKGFILDGFPRTLPQAEILEEMLIENNMPLDAVVDIQVSAGEIIKRLENRRSCPKCGKAYHLIYRKPENENMCDKCNTELIHRHDDKKHVIEHRIEVYHEKTDPLVNYYRKNGLLKVFNGEQPAKDILQAILKELKK